MKHPQEISITDQVLINSIGRASMVSLALFFTSCSFDGQNSDFAQAKQTFTSKYPTATSVKWEVDAHGNHEADFKLDGNKYRADFHPDGTWIETEESVKWSDLPEVLQEAIQVEFDKDDIVEIELVNHSSKGKFYDVEFKQKGKNMDIEYRATGERLG